MCDVRELVGENKVTDFPEISGNLRVGGWNWFLEI